MRKETRFLLAVPAYRESRRLKRFLPELLRVVSARFPAARVVLVDDGSGPEEMKSLQRLLRKTQNRYRRHFHFMALPKNRGKGGAILAAWRDRCPGFDYLGFVDADGALEPGEVVRLARELVPGGRSPALFASRVKMMGFSVQRHLFRHYAGRMFATWVGICLDPRIYDSQCGLKFIPTAMFEKISPRLRGRGFAWDIELLAGLLAVGCPIREIPVHWKDVPGTKVRFMRDSARLFWAALRAGWRKRFPEAGPGECEREGAWRVAKAGKRRFRHG
ncbi:MAG: glycosyltransferase [Actinobacteria bacterium]|nr:glycosyltransferase [Actinomycetota bacterium]